MPYRDDDHRARWPGDDRDQRNERGGPRGRDDERRSFGEQGRFSSDQARYYGAEDRNYGDYQGHRHGQPGEDTPWRRERYGSRQDEDRGVYGSGYGGQEYGMGAGGRDSYQGRLARQSYGQQGGQRRDERGYEQAPYGDRRLPHGQDTGVSEFGAPHDYAYHPDSSELHDPEYRSWRDEQLRSHDRDYSQWRAEQHHKYDEDYRAFRTERRNHFGQSFLDWLSKRDKSGQQQASGGGTVFNQEPEQVKAATDGDERRDTDNDKD